MRVLLVEDDKASSEGIQFILKSENFVVDAVTFGEEAVEFGKKYDFDIIILDLMLPDIDGYEVLRRLRGARVETPILVLSGLQETENKVKCLGFGADDYLTKPFAKSEFIARVNANTRRSKSYAKPIIETGGSKVNLDTSTFLMMYR